MSTPEIITVNSEALEAQIRELLPSQRGFGSELQASNVIMPIIDLTAAAEGSGLPESLQQAINFGGSTGFRVANATNTVIEGGTGFFRVQGNVGVFTQNGFTYEFNIFDGSTSKVLFSYDLDVTGAKGTISFDFIVYLTAADSLRATSGAVSSIISGNIRQVATVTGVLVNPVGYVAE